VIGALGGLGAAILWGCQNALNSRASRVVEPASALFFTLLVGLATALPIAVVLGAPTGATRADWMWAALAAVCAVVGLGCLFAALRRAPLSLVLPIASAQGATATVFAIIAGEALSPWQGAALGLVVAGVVVVAGARPGATQGDGNVAAAIWLAIGTAVVIGLELFALGQAEAALGPAWEIVVLRGGGLLLVAIALAGTRRIPRSPAPALRQLAVASTIENVGFVSYIIGTGGGSVAVPAVLASQFSVVGALIGVVVFDERLTRRQVAGVVSIVIGVAGAIFATA